MTNDATPTPSERDFIDWWCDSGGTATMLDQDNGHVKAAAKTAWTAAEAAQKARDVTWLRNKAKECEAAVERHPATPHLRFYADALEATDAV